MIGLEADWLVFFLLNSREEIQMTEDLFKNYAVFPLRKKEEIIPNGIIF
jgi:hypothetical protein